MKNLIYVSVHLDEKVSSTNWGHLSTIFHELQSVQPEQLFHRVMTVRLIFE